MLCRGYIGVTSPSYRLATNKLGSHVPLNPEDPGYPYGYSVEFLY